MKACLTPCGDDVGVGTPLHQELDDDDPHTGVENGFVEWCFPVLEMVRDLMHFQCHSDDYLVEGIHISTLVNEQGSNILRTSANELIQRKWWTYITIGTFVVLTKVVQRRVTVDSGGFGVYDVIL